MNAKEFGQAISDDTRALISITDDDFISVEARHSGFDCRLIHSLEDGRKLH